MADNDPTFSKLPDDVVLKILFNLEDDPRNWARLSCVSRKFSSIISTVCCRSKCLSTFPSITADLLSLSSTASSSSSSSPSPPGGWNSLYKLAVCCPGLILAGVMLDNSDFGLNRELGPDSDFVPVPAHDSKFVCTNVTATHNREEDATVPADFGGWSLYDDLYFDTVYDNSETLDDGGNNSTSSAVVSSSCNSDSKFVFTPAAAEGDSDTTSGSDRKRRKVIRRPHRSHLASGAWNLSREQGNKLLASRFRGDCLYICDWPGCVHMEEKRNYMLFRGFFKNFKRSRVWRTINDGNRSRIDLNCAFCSCKETWDLHSAFCLKRGFGFHDDGEPVVRAYVCENGHVAGAWTDLPLYT